MISSEQQPETSTEIRSSNEGFTTLKEAMNAALQSFPDFESSIETYKKRMQQGESSKDSGWFDDAREEAMLLSFRAEFMATIARLEKAEMAHDGKEISKLSSVMLIPTQNTLGNRIKGFLSDKPIRTEDQYADAREKLAAVQSTLEQWEQYLAKKEE